MYSSLYPSVWLTFNLAHNTMIGMIKIPDSISDQENRQNDPSYSRGGQFLEDFQSHVWLEFASRWFYLADFTTLIHDVNEFFSTIMNPTFGLRSYNSKGVIEPYYILNKNATIINPVYFLNDIPGNERYEPFDYDRAKEWREYATNYPNQMFR